MPETSGIEAAALKPCPFCGSEPAVVREADFVTVACSHYYCNFAQIALRNEQKAVDRWNTRACPAASGDLRERIARIIAPHFSGSAFDAIGHWLDQQVRANAFDAADAILASLPGRDEEAIRKDERERCAKVAERCALEPRGYRYTDSGAAREDIAAAIRKTGSAKP
jgi:Lar family restriction alleviation protein